MLFWQFCNIIIFVKIVGKIPDQHLNVWLVSNPGDKVQKRWRTTGQICPMLSTRIWTLSPGLEIKHTFKCWSDIFPTILTYMIMLENCQNNISAYGCSPIQGTKFYPCWNLMKPGSRSVDLVPNLIQKLFPKMEQKLVQRCETEIVANACNAS